MNNYLGDAVLAAAAAAGMFETAGGGAAGTGDGTGPEPRICGPVELSQSPNVPNSPEGIPLPDSPPPDDDAPDEEDEEVCQGQRNSPNPENYLRKTTNPDANTEASAATTSKRIGLKSSKKGGGGRKPRLIEEYDPSEPLTSSDEEEHSIQLIEGEWHSGSGTSNSSNSKVSTSEFRNSHSDGNNLNSNSKTTLRTLTPPPPITPTTVSSQGAAVSLKSGAPVSAFPNRPVSLSPPNFSSETPNSSSSNSRLSTDPSPTSQSQSDEKRRPVIHFSIPSRHRLIPRSTLVKRQKGNLKRDGKLGDGSDPNNSGKLQDGDREEDDDDETPKISLVAEIFGNDDDDEEEDDYDAEHNKTEGSGAATSITESHLQPTTGSNFSERDPHSGEAITASELAPLSLTVSTDSTDKTQLLDGNSGRWKIVANESSPPPSNDNETNDSVQVTSKESETQQISDLHPPPTAANTVPPDDGNSAITPQEDELEIIEIVTINVPARRPLRRRPFFPRYPFDNNGGEPEVIDIDQEDEDDNNNDNATVAASNSNYNNKDKDTCTSSNRIPTQAEEEPFQDPSVPLVISLVDSSRLVNSSNPTTSTAPSASKNMSSAEKSSSSARESRHGRRSYSRSPLRERPHFQRPHSSSSLSNCEEGEIVDHVSTSKRRKKDKRNKKTKKRKRSKDSRSPSPSPAKSSEKKSSDAGAGAGMSALSDKESGDRGAISWRKPSKRTQNRNYRDGKPKADDTFFRERDREIEERQRSNSPSHGNKRSRGRDTEKSPTTMKDSKSASTKHNSRKDEDSSGATYRGGKHRNRRSRSRSRSNSSASSKTFSRSRRSRRKYNRRSSRSNSRHRQGDSRSPSHITELIRSRASNTNYPKMSSRSRSRDKDKHHHRHTRSRRQQASLSRSRSYSPGISSRLGRKSRKRESSSDRQQKKKLHKEKGKQLGLSAGDEAISDSKEKRKERERLKEKEKRKRNKEKAAQQQEEERNEQKEKVKEKEKKKKKKRREKSPTPVKAIVADGDSIVVSLSFAKGKASSSSLFATTVASTSNSNAQPRASIEDQSANNKGRISNSTNVPITENTVESASSNSNQVNVNGQNDERTSSTNAPGEHRHPSYLRTQQQSSPDKHSEPGEDNDGVGATRTHQQDSGNSATTTECISKQNKSAEEKDSETVKVTSSGGGSTGSRSPFEGDQPCTAVADSTKVIASQPHGEQYESSSFCRHSMSPTDMESNVQGDSVVTSTGDTMELPLPGSATDNNNEDSSKKPGPAQTNSPSKQTEGGKSLFASLSHKAGSHLSPRFQGGQATGSATSSTVVENSAGSPTVNAMSSLPVSASGGGISNGGSEGLNTQSLVTESSSSSSASVSATTTSNSLPHRPLIGNIPGLYASSAINSSGAGGAGPVPPPPIVIPTPPLPHQGLRFPGGVVPNNTTMLNANVLASVANALLAVRQTSGGGGGNVVSDSTSNNNMQLRHINVLGPKSQNFSSVQPNLRTNLIGSSGSASNNILNSSGNNYGQDTGGDSPLSPNSSEGDDLFEPPIDKGATNNKQGKGIPPLFGAQSNNDTFNPAGGHNNTTKEKNLFDSLFESSSDVKNNTGKRDKSSGMKGRQKFRKGSKKETIKVNTSGGLTKGELRLTDEVPTSAVELIVKQKYLKKLNRQERVVEEVKLSLKPHYSKRHVNKEEYKEILRRAVPKICHNKTGEINPGKIKELVEAYVKKFRHARKRGIDISNIK